MSEPTKMREIPLATKFWINEIEGSKGTRAVLLMLEATDGAGETLQFQCRLSHEDAVYNGVALAAVGLSLPQSPAEMRAEET